MRVPVDWLREYVAVPPNADGEAIAASLVAVGLEEEGLHTGGVTGPLVVGRVLTKENFNAAQSSRLVDFRRHQSHLALELPGLGDRNDSLLIDFDVLQFGFDDLGVELDFTVLDNAEHRLADGRRHRTDARRAAADDAVLRRRHIGIASTP